MSEIFKKQIGTEKYTFNADYLLTETLMLNVVLIAH